MEFACLAKVLYILSRPGEHTHSARIVLSVCTLICEEHFSDLNDGALGGKKMTVRPKDDAVDYINDGER